MKIIGSFLIIIASVIVSFYYEKHQKEQIRLLKSVLDFLRYIKNQIEFFSLPLNDIYSRYSAKNACIDSLFKGERLKCFGEKIGDELYSCFHTLGKGFKEEEIENLEYTSLQVKAKIEELEKSYGQRVRVFRAMAIFIGCCTVILLV